MAQLARPRWLAALQTYLQTHRRSKLHEYPDLLDEDEGIEDSPGPLEAPDVAAPPGMIIPFHELCLFYHELGNEEASKSWGGVFPPREPVVSDESVLTPTDTQRQQLDADKQRAGMQHKAEEFNVNEQDITIVDLKEVRRIVTFFHLDTYKSSLSL